jgi:hypothetical protein
MCPQNTGPSARQTWESGAMSAAAENREPKRSSDNHTPPAQTQNPTPPKGAVVVVVVVVVVAVVGAVVAAPVAHNLLKLALHLPTEPAVVSPIECTEGRVARVASDSFVIRHPISGCVVCGGRLLEGGKGERMCAYAMKVVRARK